MLVGVTVRAIIRIRVRAYRIVSHSIAECQLKQVSGLSTAYWLSSYCNQISLSGVNFGFTSFLMCSIIVSMNLIVTKSPEDEDEGAAWAFCSWLFATNLCKRARLRCISIRSFLLSLSISKPSAQNDMAMSYLRAIINQKKISNELGPRWLQDWKGGIKKMKRCDNKGQGEKKRVNERLYCSVVR